MPEYVYRSADGRLREVYAPMSEAPPVGHKVVVDGVKFTRIFSCAAVEGRQSRSGFVSHSLPRWYDHHKGKFTPEGKPIFETGAQVDNCVARANGEGDHLAYG